LAAAPVSCGSVGTAGEFWQFAQASRIELRKVSGHRAIDHQTTYVVFIFAIAMGLFSGTRLGSHLADRLLTGQSA